MAIVHDDDLSFIKDVEILTADAVEKFLHENQIPVITENGGMCPVSPQGTREEPNAGFDSRNHTRPRRRAPGSREKKKRLLLQNLDSQGEIPSYSSIKPFKITRAATLSAISHGP